MKPRPLAPGSACVVCGSDLTLQIRRGPLDLLHCNHCGSEVPRSLPVEYRRGVAFADCEPTRIQLNPDGTWATL